MPNVPPTLAHLAQRAKTDNQLRFLLGLAFLALLSVLLYLPLLAGYVPFPADIVLNFPPWETHDRLCCTNFHHAEQGDFVTWYYPWHDALGRAFRSGAIPLWNSQILMGTPFAAEPQSAVFFPLNWLYGIFSTGVATGILFPLRTAIMTITMALMVKRLGSTVAGSVLAGLTFGLSGWFMAWQGSPLVDSAMWLPLMFFAVDGLRARVTPRSLALLSLAFALPVLGGHPEVAFHAGLAGASYAIFRFFPIAGRDRRYLPAFVAAGLLSLALAAVQLFSTIEWLSFISRSLNTTWGWVPPRGVITFLSRDLFANPNLDKVSIPEHAGYLGVAALALLPFALLWPTRREVIFFAGLAIAAGGIVFGVPPFYWLSQQIPVLKGLPNARLLAEADFALATLAGFGLSALQARCAGAVTRWPSALVALPASWAACSLVVLRIALVPLFVVPYVLLSIGAGLLLAFAAFTRRIAQPAFVVWIGVLLVADLMSADYGRMPFVHTADIFPPNSTFDFLRAHAGLQWRVSPVDLSYGTNFEMPFRLASPGGYDFSLTRTARLLSNFSNNPFIIHFTARKLVNGPVGLLALTSTRFFVANNFNTSSKILHGDATVFHPVFMHNGIEIFENPAALPIAFFAPREQITPVGSEEAQYQRVSAPVFDPRTTVITPLSVSTFFGNESVSSPPSTEIVSRGVNTIDINVSNNRDGLLIMNEAFYPGWHASVDGQNAPVIRANYAFMAVPVRPGTHVVHFHLVPLSFVAGATSSLLAALLLAALMIFPRRLRFLPRRRQASG